MSTANKGGATGEVPTIDGGPTKRFFVSMLTRDIELGDAILDLIDNSVDGAMRQKKAELKSPRLFDGFKVRLRVSEKEFRIEDNCGGIPADYVGGAFTLGRPTITKDGDLPTIGMYGIGMKRAIFKIGNSAIVTSNSSDGHFEVSYTSEWLNPDNTEWRLPIVRSEKKNGDSGVTINIDDVKSDIAKHFKNELFVNRLRDAIAEHFGYIIQKGFSVEVNGEQVRQKTLALFSAPKSSAGSIQPFDYEISHDDVDIRVTIGLFRGLVKEVEIDEETEGPTETETAGVSVVCNDRVVLLSDRTLKTGWGDGAVPRYHPQFRAIAGLISFYSKDAEKLPISTTKRDLDVGSDAYLLARKAAMEGLKLFTAFTNKWKGIEEETTKFFDVESRSDARTNIALAKDHGSAVRGSPSGRKFVPDLPLPSTKNTRRRISFMRPDDEIKIVSNFLLGDVNQSPSDVGQAAFDEVLKRAKKK